VDEEPKIEIVPVDPARPLYPDERALLGLLLGGPVDSAELRAQAATARVNGVCSCGCPSIRLAVDEQTPRALLDGPEVVATGGAEIRAEGAFADGTLAGVTLHILGDVRQGQGVIWELEVWPTANVGAQSSRLPPLGSLQFVR
jgi:hypothetical protein